MDTKNMINYSFNTLQSFYSQGEIKQCQWEAYTYLWDYLKGENVSPINWFMDDTIKEIKTLCESMLNKTPGKNKLQDDYVNKKCNEVLAKIQKES